MENHRKTKKQLIEELATLRESEARYQALFPAVSDAVFILDGDQIVDCNPQAQSLFGLTKEQLLGKTPYDISPPRQRDGTDSWQRGQEKISAVLKGEPQRFEWQHLGHDGINIDIELSLSLLEVSGRKLIQAVIRDITERKSAGDLYRTMARNSPIGVYLLIEGKFVYINRKFREMTGYDKGELLGRPSVDIIHPDERARVSRNALLMLKGELTEPYLFRTIQKGGAVSWSMETVVPVTFRGRRAVLGNFMDVTRQKHTEEALREGEERYRSIITNIADGYYEVDLAGRFTFFNDRISQMLGYTREETMGLDFHRYTEGESTRKVFAAFNQVYRTGIPYNDFEWEVVRKDGSRGFGEVSVSLMKDAEGKPVGFRGITRDTTERRKMEDMIRCLAYEDVLTGLPNRRAFMERLAQEVSRAGRHGQKFFIVMIDLDRFKEVNDSLGHPTGDRLLGAVAKRLQDLLRKEDTPARIGGDEFMLLIPDVREKEDGDRIGAKILAAFEAPFSLDPHSVRITTSIGLASYPDDGADEETLIRHADIALYRAKDRGRNTWAWRQ